MSIAEQTSTIFENRSILSLYVLVVVLKSKTLIQVSLCLLSNEFLNLFLRCMIQIMPRTTFQLLVDTIAGCTHDMILMY